MLTIDQSFARLNQLAAPAPLTVVPEGLGALPYPMRFVLADILSQIAAGERAALACARRVAAEDPRADARAVAQTQVRDELRHLAFFETALKELGLPGHPMPELVAMFDAAVLSADLPALLFSTHLVVEPLAHELFRDLASIFAAVARFPLMPAAWRMPLATLAEGIAAIDADESRHIAFGALRLRALREEATPAQRKHIDCVARGWRERVTTTLMGLPILRPLRPYFRSRVRKVVQKFDARMADAGVTA